MKISHLRPESQALWTSVTSDYELEPHHLRLLMAACEAWDRMTEAAEHLRTNGSYYTDPRGIRRADPALAVEKESRAAFARLLKALNLDFEIPRPAPGRPPRNSRTDECDPAENL